MLDPVGIGVARHCAVASRAQRSVITLTTDGCRRQRDLLDPSLVARPIWWHRGRDGRIGAQPAAETRPIRRPCAM
eukprot:2098148-Pyramimonas_sp.AAC.1